MPLDAVNGPTLTIEGRDAPRRGAGLVCAAVELCRGAADDAVVALDFDALDGGFALPGEADRVWAGDVDRMFVSLVPPGYTKADAPLDAPSEARVGR